MFGLKLILILVVVLIAFAMFLGSTSEVTGFFLKAKDKATDLLGSVTDRVPSLPIPGIKSPDSKTVHLVINDFDSIEFTAIDSRIDVDGMTRIEFEGNVLNKDTISLKDFTGTGTISTVLLLNGTAGEIRSDTTIREKNIKLSSFADKIDATDVRITSLNQDVTGELVLDNAQTKFSGNVALTGFTGDLSFQNGLLELMGTAESISVPSAGIRI